MSKTEPSKVNRQHHDRRVEKEERENPNRIYSQEQSTIMTMDCYKLLKSYPEIQELIIKNDYAINKIGIEEVTKYLERDLDNFVLGNKSIIIRIQKMFSDKYGIHLPEQKVTDKNEIIVAKEKLIQDLLIKREK